MIDEPRRHPDADLDPELVAAYLDGKLFDEERRVVEQAMKDRPELARQLEIDPSSAHRVRERRDPLARLGPRDGGTRARGPSGWTASLVAAALVLAFAGLWAILESDRVRTRRVSLPFEARVLSVAGLPSTVADPGSETSRIRLGEHLPAGSRLEVSRGDDLILLGPEGGFRVSRSRGLERRTPPMAEAGRVLRDRRASDSVPRRVEVSEIRAVSPTGRVAVRRPTFRWDGVLEAGSRLVLESVEGESWSISVSGDSSVVFPSDRPELRGDRAYRWTLFGPDGLPRGQQTFFAVDDAVRDDGLDARRELAGIDSPVLKDVLLLLAEDEVAFDDGISDAIARLSSSVQGLQALEVLEPTLRRAWLRREVRPFIARRD